MSEADVVESIRRGTPADAPSVARLHVEEISEGFLGTLGPAFLTRLYRRVARHPHSFVLVSDQGGEVAGFAAATEDLGRLYRDFVLRDGLLAAAGAAPRLLRSWRRVLETSRYPTSGDSLPRAELMSVAVDRRSRGRGIGRALVEASTAELARRGVAAARVVAGRENQAALALYRACGFRTHGPLQIHEGEASMVLTWP